MEHYEESPIPEPTQEEIDTAMKSIADQFGEHFESNISHEPDDDVIERMTKEGWTLVDVVTNAAKITAEAHPGREIKIIGSGKRFLIFRRS